LSIPHWEALNILVALKTWVRFLQSKRVIVWCDSKVTVGICNSGKDTDSILHAIIRNLWLFEASFDCEVQVSHIKGSHNHGGGTFI
jgi:mannitol/fructose-specific phosphotransferase system IIA component